MTAPSFPHHLFKQDSPLPPRFQFFGMGHRRKLIYQSGRLSDATSGEALRQWTVRTETFDPPEYRVTLDTTGGPVRLFEDTEGVWIEEGGDRIPLTRNPVKLPRFEGNPHAALLRALHAELLVNVMPFGPVPNLMVYPRPWYRDAALMLMCFAKTGNLSLVEPWAMGVDHVFDRNNRGMAEADNPAELFYMISLVSDRRHPLVEKILKEVRQNVTPFHVIVVLAVGLLSYVSSAQVSQQVDALGKPQVWRTFRQMRSPPITAPIVPEKQPREYEYVGGHIAGPNTAAPATNWIQAEFDDQSWAFTGSPASPSTGGGDLGTASIQVRTRFGVTDPARAAPMAVSLTYRGGVTVYVNGREVGRKDMPEGTVDAPTPALDYPVEAFTGPEAKQALPPQPASMKDDDPNAQYYRMRTRSAVFQIPAGALRAGMNLLAIQNSRAPYRHEALRGHWHGYVGRTIWPTVVILGVSLRAPSADGILVPVRPPVRVWNAGTLTMVGPDASEPDPFAELKPLHLQAPRGHGMDD